MCSVRQKVVMPLDMACWTTSSSVLAAWPQNWPECEWWENGIVCWDVSDGRVFQVNCEIVSWRLPSLTMGIVLEVIEIIEA